MAGRAQGKACRSDDVPFLKNSGICFMVLQSVFCIKILDQKIFWTAIKRKAVEQ